MGRPVLAQAHQSGCVCKEEEVHGGKTYAQVCVRVSMCERGERERERDRGISKELGK